MQSTIFVFPGFVNNNVSSNDIKKLLSETWLTIKFWKPLTNGSWTQTSTPHHKHTLHKLPLACIISTRRSWHSPIHLSFSTATLLLCGDIQPNPGPTLSSNLLIYTLNARSMLTHEHVTALNDLTDNHKPDIIALAETWIRSFTILAELIDSTSPGYSLFSASRSHNSNSSKPISAGGNAFLIKEPFIDNSVSHHYSSFAYSSIMLKFSIDHPTITLFITFLYPS